MHSTTDWLPVATASGSQFKVENVYNNRSHDLALQFLTGLQSFIASFSSLFCFSGSQLYWFGSLSLFLRRCFQKKKTLVSAKKADKLIAPNSQRIASVTLHSEAFGG